MKNVKFFLSMLLLASVVSLVSCKKDPEPTPLPVEFDYPEAPKVDGKITIFAKFDAGLCENGSVVLAGSYNEWSDADGSAPTATTQTFVSAGVIDGKDWGAEGWYKVQVSLAPVKNDDGEVDPPGNVLGAKPVHLKDGVFFWDYQIGAKSTVEVKGGDVEIQDGYANECNIFFLSNSSAALIFKAWKNDPCEEIVKHDVKFSLTVPESTPADAEIFIAGSFATSGYPSWGDAFESNDMKLSKVGDKYEITLSLKEGNIEYKYIMNPENKDDWSNEEVKDDCTGVANHTISIQGTATFNDVVANWKGYGDCGEQVIPFELPYELGEFKDMNQNQATQQGWQFDGAAFEEFRDGFADGSVKYLVLQIKASEVAERGHFNGLQVIFNSKDGWKQHETSEEKETVVLWGSYMSYEDVLLQDFAVLDEDNDILYITYDFDDHPDIEGYRNAMSEGWAHLWLGYYNSTADDLFLVSAWLLGEGDLEGFLPEKKEPVTILGPETAISTKTWTVGDQVWSDYIAYDDGTTTWGDVTVGAGTSGEGKYKKHNDEDYYMYNWYYVANHQSDLCPAQWRVPTKQDIEDLDEALGGLAINSERELTLDGKTVTVKGFRENTQANRTHVEKYVLDAGFRITGRMNVDGTMSYYPTQCGYIYLQEEGDALAVTAVPGENKGAHLAVKLGPADTGTGTLSGTDTWTIHPGNGEYDSDMRKSIGMGVRCVRDK